MTVSIESSRGKDPMALVTSIFECQNGLNVPHIGWEHMVSQSWKVRAILVKVPPDR